MRKGRMSRRTVVKEAGQKKQVLLERVDVPRKGPKSSSDLKQHLHRLFHHYYEPKHEDTEEEAEEEE